MLALHIYSSVNDITRGLFVTLTFILRSFRHKMEVHEIVFYVLVDRACVHIIAVCTCIRVMVRLRVRVSSMY